MWIVLIAIVILVIVFNKNEEPALKIKMLFPQQKKEDYTIVDFTQHFMQELNNTLKFIKAYREEVPGEWVFIDISPICEKGKYCTDNYWYYEEFIEFKITVGCWCEGILYMNKDIKEYIETIYTFDPSDMSFSYKIRIGNSTNCMIPRNIVMNKFFDCLDIYEKNNSGEKLSRTSYGVHHQWNL